jgi:hypothetical protein
MDLPLAWIRMQLSSSCRGGGVQTTQRLIRSCMVNYNFVSNPGKDMDICRPKDHKGWSRPPFWGLSGYEPMSGHEPNTGMMVYLAKPRAHIRVVPGSNPGHYTTKVVFSPQIQPQANTSFLVLQHHFFLSLPRPSLERTVDAKGVRRIWIYAAQRTTKDGRDHPFGICQTPLAGAAE